VSNNNQNQNRPKFSLPGRPPVPPPPPAAQGQQSSAIDRVREQFADVLETYPLPWVVGPFGDIWVAEDVEQYDPEKEAAQEKHAGPNGTWWRTTESCKLRGRPRLVAEISEVQDMHRDMAALIVIAANAMAR
jgi:hypothetical protein